MVATRSGRCEAQQVLTLEQCPCCYTASHLERYRSFPNDWNLDSCRVCSFTFLNPQPAPEQLAAMYSEPAYFSERVDDTPSEEKVRARARYLLPVIDELRTATGKVGRVLEVGCGYGSFLGAAQLAGWDPVGIELSPHAAAFARKCFDIEVHNTGVEKVSSLNLGKFTAVVMMNVLEHIPQPLTVLQELRQLLEPNGVLWAVVPNLASMDRRWHGDYWSGWDLPYHLSHFSPRTARGMFERAGFKSVRIEPTFFNPLRHLKVAIKVGNLRADVRSWKLSGPLNSQPRLAQSLENWNDAIVKLLPFRGWVKRFFSERDMNVWGRI